MKPGLYKTKVDLKQIFAATWYLPFLEIEEKKKKKCVNILIFFFFRFLSSSF